MYRFAFLFPAVENKESHEVLHYVEKPSTFVSKLINCGVYICSLDIFDMLQKLYNSKQDFYKWVEDIQMLITKWSKDKLIYVVDVSAN